MIKIFKTKGFTLVELMVSVAIFAFMTAFLLAKYGKFDQSVLLTNLAYDIALSIRTAQSYGISVKNTNGVFDSAYGMHFTRGSSSFEFFIDPDLDGVYGSDSLKTYTIKKNIKIKSLCAGTAGSCTYNDLNSLDVSFRRPDPNAIIKSDGDKNSPNYNYAEIILESTDGSVKKVQVRGTGQIAVTN